MAVTNAVMEKITQRNRSPVQDYEQAALEAVREHKRGQEQSPFPPNDIRNGKLSAPAYFALAKKNAGISDARLDEINALLEQTPMQDREHVEFFMGCLWTGMVSTNPFAGCDLEPVTQGFEHRCGVGQVANDAWAQCSIQLQGLNIRPLDIVALAARQATQRHPESFGKLDKPPSQSAPPRLPELLKLLPELAVSSGSVALLLVDEKLALWRATWRWKGTDSGVPLAPTVQSASAFVEWLAVQ